MTYETVRRHSGTAMRAAIVLLAVTLALAACSGRDHRIPPTAGGAGAISSSSEVRACLADLDRTDVRFTALPDRVFEGGCRATGSVKLLDYGIPTSNLGAMTCPLARSFTSWARGEAAQAARETYGSALVKIETMGTYACRNVNGRSTGKLSEHAYANAVDVSAFILDDGRRISVQHGWNGGPRDRAFLRALHRSACGRFGTVLGPDYNAAHYNHFHFDMSGGRYCR